MPKSTNWWGRIPAISNGDPPVRPPAYGPLAGGYVVNPQFLGLGLPPTMPAYGPRSDTYIQSPAWIQAHGGAGIVERPAAIAGAAVAPRTHSVQEDMPIAQFGGWVNGLVPAIGGWVNNGGFLQNVVPPNHPQETAVQNMYRGVYGMATPPVVPTAPAPVQVQAPTMPAPTPIANAAPVGPIPTFGPLRTGYVQSPQWIRAHGGVGIVERPNAQAGASISQGPATVAPSSNTGTSYNPLAGGSANPGLPPTYNGVGGNNPNEPAAMPNQYNQQAVNAARAANAATNAAGAGNNGSGGNGQSVWTDSNGLKHSSDYHMNYAYQNLDKYFGSGWTDNFIANNGVDPIRFYMPEFVNDDGARGWQIPDERGAAGRAYLTDRAAYAARADGKFQPGAIAEWRRVHGDADIPLEQWDRWHKIAMATGGNPMNTGVGENPWGVH